MYAHLLPAIGTRTGNLTGARLISSEAIWLRLWRPLHRSVPVTSARLPLAISSSIICTVQIAICYFTLSLFIALHYLVMNRSLLFLLLSPPAPHQSVNFMQIRPWSSSLAAAATLRRCSGEAEGRDIRLMTSSCLAWRRNSFPEARSESVTQIPQWRTLPGATHQMCGIDVEAGQGIGWTAILFTN